MFWYVIKLKMKSKTTIGSFKQKQKIVISIRDPNEIYHRKGINSMCVQPIS